MKKLLLVAFVLSLVLLTACGGGSGDDAGAVDTPAVGETLITNVIDAAANANGDGVADTETTCNNIVC